jgi:hypothetical protein
MMTEPILITERYEYDYCVKHGYEPLLDIRNFALDIKLRVDIQRELFGHCNYGRGNIPVANQRFFRWIWAHKPHRCEETMRPLPVYSATFCSHILTRGAYPEMAHDPRNINILCFEMHNRWENGDRENMRIYPGNLKIIELLKKEYNSLR